MVGGDGIVNGPWWVMVGYEESSVKRLVDSILNGEMGKGVMVKLWNVTFKMYKWLTSVAKF